MICVCKIGDPILTRHTIQTNEDNQLVIIRDIHRSHSEPLDRGCISEPTSVEVSGSYADVGTIVIAPSATNTRVRTVYGNVVDDLDAPIVGVLISITGAYKGSATTDASGDYTVYFLYDGDVIVTPDKDGYMFTSLEETIAGSNVECNFVGERVVVSGNITVDSVPLAEVTVSMTGEEDVETDEDGDYSFAPVIDGAKTITPVKVGYEFDPATLEIEVDRESIASNNFAATLTAFTSITEGAKVLVSSPMNSTNRAFALRALSATLGVMVYSADTTTAPVVQAVTLVDGVATPSGTAVPFATSSADFDPAVWFENKGSAYVDIAAVSDTVFAVHLKLAGRNEGYFRAGYISAGQATMAGVGSSSLNLYGAILEDLSGVNGIFGKFFQTVTASNATSIRTHQVNSDYSLEIALNPIVLGAVPSGTVFPGLALVKASTSRCLVIFDDYVDATHVFTAVDVYDDGVGTLALGTKLVLYAGSSSGLVRLLDVAIPTCIAFYTAAGTGGTRFALRKLTLLEDHTVTVGDPVGVETVTSGYPGLIKVSEYNMVGSYRYTSAGTFKLFLCDDTPALVGSVISGNGAAAISVGCVLSALGSTPVAMFVDTASGDGYLQTFVCA